jgi:DNA polymerase
MIFIRSYFMGNSSKTEAMKKIRDEVVACDKCLLGKYRRQNNYLPVIGQGNHNARIMFVGEAPGLNEAKTGRPFCGASGKILDELLASAGIKREDVYIGNILKDRPPDNRNPLPKEIIACTPYLEKQIEIINPKVIGALGNFSTGFLMEKYGLKDKIQGISKIHGQIFIAGPEFGKKIIIPLYHPAVAVYNANMKETLINDFKIMENSIN